MARCLLADVLAAGVEAFMDRLTLNDYKNLRQVNHGVSECISIRIPHILLRLSDSSTTQQLRQWFKATQRLKYVPSIHIHVGGEVPAELFELAMQLLSQRTSTKELHLLNVNLGFFSSNISFGIQEDFTKGAARAVIPSLQPVEHLMPHLQVLVIDGIEVKNLPQDLKQLAAAASSETGWKLQCLTLKAAWSDANRVHWSKLPSALQHLTKATPRLTHLDIQLPPLAYSPLVACGSSVAASPYKGASHRELLDFDGWKTHQAKTAVVAALTNAAMQLECIKTLSVSGTPDIWGSSAAAHDKWAAKAMASVTAAVDAVLVAGRLPSTAIATAAFPTLDDCGCWLMQQHSTVQNLRISTEGSGLSMSWQQPQQQPQLCHANQGSSSTIIAAEISTVDMPLYTSLQSYRRFDINSSDEQFLSTCCKLQLSQYSSRPLVYLLCRISSCQLTVEEQWLKGLQNLLGDLKALKHLRIKVPKVDNRDGASGPKSLSQVITAAAAVQDLRSLAISTTGYACDLQLSDDLLLPLTAAAGGPGSSLTKLELKGNFDTGTTPAAAAASGWQAGLKQLNGLVELRVACHHWRDKVEILVDSLPAGLKVFHGYGLNMKSTAAAVAGGSEQDTTADPQLQKLSLHNCHLSSPSILASSQLQQLSVIDSSWPGGWAAAAAAWPAVERLSWEFDSADDQHCSICSKQGVEDFEVHRLTNFQRLVYIKLKDERGLKQPVIEEALRPLDRCMQLVRYINFDCSNSCLSSKIAGLIVADRRLTYKLFSPWASVSVACPPHLDLSEV